MINVHKSITLTRIMNAIEDSGGGYPGFCVTCGEETYGVEPDASGYTCEYCGAPTVYGAEELLVHLVP